MIKESAAKGKSAYTISQETGVSKNTVRKYITQPARPHGLKGVKKGSKKHRLSGVIEFDDSYFGGPTARQKRGRGTEKAKVLVALSLSESGSPLYLKMMVTPNIKQVSVKKFAQSAFAQGSTVRRDGYRSYIPALEDYTHEHKPYVPNSGLLHWLHIVVGNAKAFVLGTYHGLPKENLQSYLDEYCFRFSRRFFGPDLLERLALAVGSSVRLN